MQRCLVLAVLLHIWLVLVFGNAPGTAAPGQGAWGSLTVKLMGRSGGDLNAPPSAPAAASPTRPAMGHPDAAAAEAPPPSTATLALPEGFRPVERQELLPLTPPNPQAQLAELPAADLPAPVNRLEASPDTVAPLRPDAPLRPPEQAPALPALPTELPAPVSRMDAPAPTVTALPRPAELRAAPTPATAAPALDVPPPVQRLEAAPADTLPARLSRPAELRAAPSAVTPGVPSAALPPAVQRLEAPASDNAAVPRLARPSDLRAPASSAAAALPSAPELPSAVRRLEPGDSAPAVDRLQAAPAARPNVASPNAAALSQLADAVPGPVAASAGPARGDPNANTNMPPGTERLGPNVPAPPTAAASAPRAPLNLSLPRGDMTARRSNSGLVDLIPPPPERKSKLEQSIEDAASKDCRNAYSGAGILAVVPLAVDAVRGKGCKW